MSRRAIWLGTFGLTLIGTAFGESNVVLRGKVVMDDGSVPPRKVTVERFCTGTYQFVASTNPRGEYLWHTTTEANASGLLRPSEFAPGILSSFSDIMNNLHGSSICVLRAKLAGYESNSLDIADVNIFSNPVLPDLVISRAGSQPNFDSLETASVPRTSAKAWARAVRLIRLKDWPAAERELRAVVDASPRFTQGWTTLAGVLLFERKQSDARDAYQHAITANPKFLPSYLMLSRLSAVARDWEATAKTAAAFITADTNHHYPEAFLYQAIARYQTGDIDGADASSREALRLDQNHDVPRAEYVYGLVLEARHDFNGAREHMSRYLELDPKAADARAVRLRMENLGKSAPADVATELAGALSNLPSHASELTLAHAGNAWVPGGLKALANAAHLESVPTPQNFFADYSRAIANEFSYGMGQGIPRYLETLRSYMASVAALSLIGEHRENRTIVSISLKDEAGRESAGRILPLLGWKLVPTSDGVHVELSDRPEDGNKQQILSFLGIDPLDMQSAIEARQTFQFELLSEDAHLVGGEAWTELLREKNVPGGIAGAFATDIRLAQAYAGLAFNEPRCCGGARIGNRTPKPGHPPRRHARALFHGAYGFGGTG